MKQVGNTILAKGVNHILAKRDNSAWPKGAKLSGFSSTSAFMNVEAWRKNENTSSFDRLVKGALLTVEGYFKPEEWQDAEGVKHSRVILVATKFYEAE